MSAPDPAALLSLAGRAEDQCGFSTGLLNTEFRHPANKAERETIVWQPSLPVAASIVTAAQSPFGVMPKHLSAAGEADIIGAYKSMTFKKPDSVVCLGRLDPESYRLFSRPESLPRERSKTTFWVKTPGEDHLAMPADLARFLPAIDLHVQAELANLPFAELWKYMRIRVALDSSFVEGGKHQRLGNRPHQDLGDKLSKPLNVDFSEAAAPLQIPHINGNLYIVHDEAPTIFMRDVPYLPDGEDRRAHLVDPVSFENGAVIKYNYFTWHLAGKVDYPTFRNFMAIQADIDRKMLAQDIALDSILGGAVQEWLQQDHRLPEIKIPAVLQRPALVRRHAADNVYNYDL